MGALDTAEKIFTLTANVSRLQDDVSELAKDVRDLRDRVKALEMQGDLTAEKAKNASLQATIEVTQRLTEKMALLEARTDGRSLGAG